MDADLSIAAIAALVGKRARARMPTSQMDGRAHAARELAYSAGVTPPQTASSHLAKLLRERRLAELLESIESLIAAQIEAQRC
jgi:hypothetical protein